MAAKRSELKGALTRLARALEVCGEVGNIAEVELEKWSPGDGCTRYRLSIRGREVGNYAQGAGEMFSRLNFAADLLERVHAPRVACGICGEEARSTGSMAGSVHRWGPTDHDFSPTRR